VAVLGMVIHAGLMVRHQWLMLAAGLSEAAQALSFSVICHTGGEAPSSGGPQPQKPIDSGEDCPICVGVVNGIAVLPTVMDLPLAPPRQAARISTVGQCSAQRPPRLVPPARGPPLSA
jgi:hypothetical protein